MWWWQSAAFGGALDFGSSVPVDQGTATCACVRVVTTAAETPAAIASTVRRFHSLPGIVASLVVRLHERFPQWCARAFKCAIRPSAPLVRPRSGALDADLGRVNPIQCRCRA